MQVEELSVLEESLIQQKDRLEREVANERTSLGLLLHTHKDKQRQVCDMMERGVQDVSFLGQEEVLIQQAEHRLQFKERQLQSLREKHLPAVSEERQRAIELLERVRGGTGSPGLDESPEDRDKELDETLYQVEKELEEKEERLSQYSASAEQLQQLQQSYAFTANVARQEEKVRRKEKEILEWKEKQQREALEQAVTRLERRHFAYRRSLSLEPDAEGPRKRSQSALGQSTSRFTRKQDLDQDRMEREIAQLKQRISESEGSVRSLSVSGDEKNNVTQSPVSPIQSLPTVLSIGDERINTYIEEEVQRRLQKLNLRNRENNNTLSLSSDSLQDNNKKRIDQRKLKYERLVSVPLDPSPESLKDPVKISIPRYVLCGQGKDEHFEFEVKITVLDETWTVFRRYSRFREMHKSLKLKYPELAALDFPPKKIFGNRDERMVAERRNQLEQYLRNFFHVMMSSSSSSPLRTDEFGLHLSKHAVCSISPFFKKGVFDYSSHGTG
ncbi:hypothetical protein cypCar_00003532 [Cyprinus carpio]|nr:hypothetical protein cypCar_00003532 [Cyprinus carpio]